MSLQRKVIVLAVLCLSLFASSAFAEIVGWLDTITPVAGWACQKGSSTATTRIDVYVESTIVMSLPGNRPSEKAVADACGVPYGPAGTKNYRFALPTGDLVKAAKAKGVKSGTYNIHFYGVASGNAELSGSPKSLYIP